MWKEYSMRRHKINFKWPYGHFSISATHGKSKEVKKSPFYSTALKRLNDFISANNILPHHQFGFRRAHSAAHQLRRLVNHIVRNSISLFLGESVVLHWRLALLDVEKVFDSVWHKLYFTSYCKEEMPYFEQNSFFSSLKGCSFQVSRLEISNRHRTTFLTVFHRVQFCLLPSTLLSLPTWPVMTIMYNEKL
jgi:hypothetical protein